MLPFDTLLLDMDGLLLDTERVCYRAYLHVAQEMGETLSVAQYATLIGRRAGEIGPLLTALYEGRLDGCEFYARVVPFYRNLIKKEGVPLKAGAGALFDFLDAHGIRRAVATSTRREWARYKLERAGILERVECVIGGEDAPRGKPAPDIYLKALAALRADARRAWGLEDSPVGLRALRAAGVRAVMIPDLAPPSPETASAADAVFPSLGAFVASLS